MYVVGLDGYRQIKSEMVICSDNQKNKVLLSKCKGGCEYFKGLDKSRLYCSYDYDHRPTGIGLAGRGYSEYWGR